MIKSQNFETKTSCVVAGAYEDREYLMNDDHYYRIRIPNPVNENSQIVIKTFFGTIEQICTFMHEISDELHWCEYYASTIDAWMRYMAGDHGAVHIVGGKEERLLTPVSEICRSAYLIDNVSWRYANKYGCTLPAFADTVEISQVLLRDEDRLYRCATYWFNDVSSAHSEKGWVAYNGDSCGVPCMMDAHRAGVITNRLMIIEEEYKDICVAFNDMKAENLFNFQQISREMFSGL